MASFEMPSRHRSEGSSDVPDADWLIVLSVSVSVIGLLVLAAIAFSNWRAAHVIKQARKEWSTFPTGKRRGLINEEVVKPNPLRKVKK